MSASQLDYFQKVGRSTATTLSAPGYTTGVSTSINVASTTNWPTDTGITFAIDVVDAQGVRETGTYNIYRGTVNGATQITNVTWVGGDGDRSYSAGATTRVYILVSYARDNRLVDGLLIEHEQDGTHGVELVTSRTEDTNPDPDADFLLTYDTSAAALKKVKPSNLSGGLTGWTSNVLPSVSSVTYNGNRSYDVTFGSTVASYLTPGMRVRTSRTVTAPTTVFSLDGSNDYYNKTSPSGMTFTDDFVVSAWVRLSSYALGTIASRYNGTSGWALQVLATGQIQLGGYNGGVANNSIVTSYQSIPLNKWVHITAQLDMSSFTATTTTSYVMLDGVDVPASVSRGGTNPTALVQAGNLEIGSANAGSFFGGYITDVMIFNAKVTQATMRGYMSQTPSGSETSLISAYKNGSTTDLNTGNANNLTAQNGATTSTSYAPYTVDANGTPGGTYDYGIVTKVSTTTATVQVPEGCAIPTSGGVSAVDLSAYKVPYGFPAQVGRWEIESFLRASITSGTTANTWYSGATTTSGSFTLNFPVGSWSAEACIKSTSQNSGATSYRDISHTLSTANNAESDTHWTTLYSGGTYGTTVSQTSTSYKTGRIDVTTATPYYALIKENGTLTLHSMVGEAYIRAYPSNL